MQSVTDPKESIGTNPAAANDPDEAIDTPKEVEESNDEKIDQDFPGYPHYPAKEDILNPENSNDRLDIDVENLTRSHTITQEDIKNTGETPAMESNYSLVEDVESDEGAIKSGSDADVTAEDLALLGPRDQDQDLDEDEDLRSRGWEPVTGKDLDVPDAELDGDELPGEEDEENSYYSLGGDRMENLEENDDQNNF